jgi:hypothetical protein
LDPSYLLGKLTSLNIFFLGKKKGSTRSLHLLLIKKCQEFRGSKAFALAIFEVPNEI